MERRMEISAQRGNLDSLLEIIRQDLEQAQCPADVIGRISVCAEEIFVNICSYAYPADEGLVWVEERIGKNDAVYVFSDTGAAYDPLSAKEPDITLPAGEREIGGLGIFLVKNLAEHTAYDRRGGSNHLRLSFSWYGTGEPAQK